MKLKATPANPDSNTEVTLVHPSDHLSAAEFVEQLIEPLMLGLGYQRESIIEAFASYHDKEPECERVDSPAPTPPEGYVLLGFDVDDATHPPYYDREVQYLSRSGWADCYFIDGGGVWYAARIGSDAAKAFGKGGDE